MTQHQAERLDVRGIRLSTGNGSALADEATSEEERQPVLLYFRTGSSGECRRVDGYLAQTLQRRHNHGTFRVVQVAIEKYPDLAARLGVRQVPTFVVLDGDHRTVLEPPVSAGNLRELLRPWLR